MKDKITRGSGNVFADLGFDNPSEHQAKADLAMQVIKIIEQRKLTQKEAASLIGAAQPDISKLKAGQLKGFTLDRLLSFLLHLDRNIEIRVSKPRGKEKRGVLETVAA
ncbi:MAG: XRE family transcriptional regulator [Micavibrio sp.]|nr:XRE family transcriptional regulator [Micavibrio sp.]